MTTKYALVIGNTQYSDPGLAKLTAPGMDAKAFARVLESKDICAFDDVKVLLNEPEPVVREAIDALFDQKKPDDLLLLYFSGHGVRDEFGSLYLAVRNTNRLRLRATAVKSDFIRESMDESRSRRQVLILDCCNSGAFAQGTKGATGVSIGTASAFEGTGYGRVVLTASDATQFAWEGDKVIGSTQNSLFTHFLVKGLEGEADTDSDGRITIDELYDYAYEQIVNATPKQTPGKWSYKQQGEIILRQSRRPEEIKPVRLPEDLMEEVDDTRPYVREAAVQKLIKILQGRNIGLRRSAQQALEKIAADDNTTRRVAVAATEALEAFRKQSAQAETSAAEGKPIEADQEVVEVAETLHREHRTLAQMVSERVRKAIGAGAAREPTKLAWRPIGMASIGIAALAFLGYAGVKYLPAILSPVADTPAAETTPTALPAGPGGVPPLVFDTGSAEYSVVFSPDGKTLAFAGSDQRITLGDVASGQRLGDPITPYSGAVYSLAFSPDGKTLASGSQYKSVGLWDVRSHKAIGEPLDGHTEKVTAVAFSPDGKAVVSGSTDKTIIVWDVATRQQTTQVNTGPVEGLAFSPDGRMLASCDDEGNITLWEWDAAHQLPTGTVLRRHSGPVYSVAFSPDGKILASGSGDKTVILWNVETRQPIGHPLKGHADAVTSVAFSPDGKTLASGSQDKTIILWDVKAQAPIGQPLRGYEQPIHSVAFSPDGNTLASAADDNFMLFWDVSSLHVEPAVPTATGQAAQPVMRTLKGHTRSVIDVAFSPDGKTLASSSADDTIILWDVVTGKPIGEPLEGHADYVESVAFSPDGKSLASGSDDRTIILWNVTTHRSIGEPIRGPNYGINAVAFSPDGKILAAASNDAIFLWDVATRNFMGKLFRGPSNLIASIAFSPDSKLIASGGHNQTVVLWDVATRKPIGEPLKGPFKGASTLITSVAFSPEGKTLAAAGQDKTVILWDVATLQPVGLPLDAHTDAVTSVAFSPDGTMLASGSWDNTVRLWDVQRQNPIGQPLIGHDDYVLSVAFSPDGKTLASGGRDSNVVLWDIPSILKNAGQ